VTASRTDQRDGPSAKASFLAGAVLLFAIVVASIVALGVGWIVFRAGLGEGLVRLVACLTWGGVLISIFIAHKNWRKRHQHGG
jgi:hypothetical protein